MKNAPLLHNIRLSNLYWQAFEHTGGHPAMWLYSAHVDERAKSKRAPLGVARVFMDTELWEGRSMKGES